MYMKHKLITYIKSKMVEFSHALSFASKNVCALAHFVKA